MGSGRGGGAGVLRWRGGWGTDLRVVEEADGHAVEDGEGLLERENEAKAACDGEVVNTNVHGRPDVERGHSPSLGWHELGNNVWLGDP